MAEKRQNIKTVSGEEMAKGVYLAAFADGSNFRADLRELPGPDGAPIGAAYDSFPPMVQRTLQYGIKQKLDDSMAGAESVEEAAEEIRSTWDAIKAGNWTIRVAGEGVEGGLFARAFAAFKGVSLADAKAQIATMVERNLEANRAAIADPKKREELTERMVFNKVRETALERYPELKAKYDELREARKSKRGSRSDIKVDLTE